MGKHFQLVSLRHQRARLLLRLLSSAQFRSVHFEQVQRKSQADLKANHLLQKPVSFKFGREQFQSDLSFFVIMIMIIDYIVYSITDDGQSAFQMVCK